MDPSCIKKIIFLINKPLWSAFDILDHNLIQTINLKPTWLNFSFLFQRNKTYGLCAWTQSMLFSAWKLADTEDKHNVFSSLWS